MSNVMGRPRILSDEQIEAIYRLYTMGAFVSVIGAAVGVDKATIWYHCDPLSRERRGLPPLDVAPGNQRKSTLGVKRGPYKSRQPKAAPAKTTSLEPVSLDEARKSLGMSVNDSGRQMMAHLASQNPPPRRGLFARIFGT